MISPLSRRPSVSVVALAAFLAWGASACAKREAAAPAPAAGTASAPPAEPAAAKTVVKLGNQKIGAPFLLKTRSEGLDARLKQLNAAPEWREFKHGPALLEAIHAGEVDVGYVGETPPVFAQAGDVAFVYVATDPPAPKAEAIIVRKDSPIKTVAQLRGKKVALNRGSNVHYLLIKALERAKLTIKDVEVVYLAPGDARPAFDTGKVDAWVIWDPFYAAAEQAGARTLANGEGLVDNNLFYVARRAFAETQPALVQAVLDEFRTLSAWESKNPEEASRLLAQSSGISYEALLTSERRHTYGILPITPEVLAKQQAIADSFRALALIPKDIRTADAFLQTAAYAAKP